MINRDKPPKAWSINFRYPFHWVKHRNYAFVKFKCRFCDKVSEKDSDHNEFCPVKQLYSEPAYICNECGAPIILTQDHRVACDEFYRANAITYGELRIRGLSNEEAFKYVSEITKSTLNLTDD